MSLDSKRIIEINHYGKFYVNGALPLAVVLFDDPYNTVKGWWFKPANNPKWPAQSLIKLDEQCKPVAPAIFTNKDMAEEVCEIINKRLR